MSSTEKYEAFYTETYEGDYSWVDSDNEALDDGLEEYPYTTLEDDDYVDLPMLSGEWPADFDEFLGDYLD